MGSLSRSSHGDGGGDAADELWRLSLVDSDLAAGRTSRDFSRDFVASDFGGRRTSVDAFGAAEPFGGGRGSGDFGQADFGGGDFDDGREFGGARGSADFGQRQMSSFQASSFRSAADSSPGTSMRMLQSDLSRVDLGAGAALRSPPEGKPAQTISSPYQCALPCVSCWPCCACIRRRASHTPPPLPCVDRGCRRSAPSPSLTTVCVARMPPRKVSGFFACNFDCVSSTATLLLPQAATCMTMWGTKTSGASQDQCAIHNCSPSVCRSVGQWEMPARSDCLGTQQLQCLPQGVLRVPVKLDRGGRRLADSCADMTSCRQPTADGALLASQCFCRLSRHSWRTNSSRLPASKTPAPHSFCCGMQDSLAQESLCGTVQFFMVVLHDCWCFVDTTETIFYCGVGLTQLACYERLPTLITSHPKRQSLGDTQKCCAG